MFPEIFKLNGAEFCLDYQLVGFLLIVGRVVDTLVKKISKAFENFVPRRIESLELQLIGFWRHLCFKVKVTKSET